WRAEQFHGRHRQGSSPTIPRAVQSVCRSWLVILPISDLLRANKKKIRGQCLLRLADIKNVAVEWISFSHTSPTNFLVPWAEPALRVCLDVAGYPAGPSHPAAINRVQKPAGVVFAIQDNRM